MTPSVTGHRSEDNLLLFNPPLPCYGDSASLAWSSERSPHSPLPTKRVRIWNGRIETLVLPCARGSKAIAYSMCTCALYQSASAPAKRTKHLTQQTKVLRLAQLSKHLLLVNLRTSSVREQMLCLVSRIFSPSLSLSPLPERTTYSWCCSPPKIFMLNSPFKPEHFHACQSHFLVQVPQGWKQRHFPSTSDVALELVAQEHAFQRRFTKRERVKIPETFILLILKKVKY